MLGGGLISHQTWSGLCVLGGVIMGVGAGGGA